MSVPGSSSVGQRPLRPGCSILLVEDHADTLAALSKLLSMRGHVVLTADCCARAMKVAEEAAAKGSPIDLVIGDIGLPDGDGVLLMCELKGRLGCPVIALSGYGMDGDLQRCAEAGIDRHLLKPVGAAQLEKEMKWL